MGDKDSDERENKQEDKQENKQKNEQGFNHTTMEDSQVGQGNGDVNQAQAGEGGQAVAGGGDAVKADKDGQAANAGGDAANIKADVNDKVEGDVNVAQKIFKIHNDKTEIKNIFKGELGKTEIKKFSISDTKVITEEEILRVKDTFVYPEDKKKELISHLSGNRTLLLTGKAETGKFFTAKYLAYRMNRENRKSYNIRTFRPYDGKIDINPQKIIENSKELKETILIFENIFYEKNRNFIDHFFSYIKDEINDISKKLKDADAFILFTADKETFKPGLLSKIAITRKIVQLDKNLLQKGFELNLKYFCRPDDKWDFEKASKLFKPKLAEVVDKLKLYRVSSFLKGHLEKILSGEESIDKALESFLDIRKTVEDFFLIELGEKKEEFETWTFALCLALFNRSSYFFFTAIHRVITKKMLPLFNSVNSGKEFSFMRSESKLLEKVGAVISKNSLVDTIEFEHSKYREVLIDILLQHNRKALISLIPILEEYIVERYLPHEQRVLLADGMSRIGMIDPQNIISPLINRWAKKEGFYHKINVGYLYKGIITHGDENCRKYCLTKLKDMALSEEYDIQLTAIAAYTEIGYQKLETAMEELRMMHEAIIQRMSTQEKDFMLEYLFSLDTLLNKRIGWENFEDELAAIYEKALYLLSTIPYSFVDWAIDVDFMGIFEGLRKWIDKAEKTSKNIIVLFVIGNGYVDEYEAFEFKGILRLLEDGQDNLLPEKLSVGEEQVNKLTAFLVDLYSQCFPEFSADVARRLKRSLFKYIEIWTKKNLSNVKIIDAVEELIVRFYHAGDEGLKDTLWDNMNRWKASGEDEEKLNAFVDNVSKRIFNM